jgi:type IV pilus assembly protein PilQ
MKMMCILLFVFTAAGAIASGPLVTIDVVNGDVREVYNRIAGQAGYNIVLLPSVKGTITVKLEAVPWRKALEVVLETMGHEAHIEGNTIFVAPMGRLR